MGYTGASRSLGTDDTLQYQKPETETAHLHPAATMATV